ncbi:MAG TPA: phosphoribosylglycinamide formyltransferase [Gammaproteobacteria bacterium]
MTAKWKLAFLASHRGSNMQALVDACRDGRLAAEPVVVISNNGSAAVLDRAASAGIPAFHLGSSNHPDADALDRVIAATLQQYSPDLVLLAGYMKRVGPRTLRAFPGRILNIHPALLPKHGGRGMYGKKVHEAVVAAGDAETGITVHVVDGEYDTGAILAQRRVSVQKGETAEALAARLLPMEHELYVDTVGKIIRGEIRLPRAA